MQLFDSVRMYVLAFSVYALVAVEKLYELAKSPAPASTAGFGVREVLIVFVTICVAGYLIRLLRKTSIRIEQMIIVLTEALCILWLANLLANLGISWAEIPLARGITATVHCAATVLAGVRTFQVEWHRRRAQKA